MRIDGQKYCHSVERTEVAAFCLFRESAINYENNRHQPLSVAKHSMGSVRCFQFRVRMSLISMPFPFHPWSDDHEKDGEINVSGSTAVHTHEHGRVLEPAQHVTVAYVSQSDCCAGGLTPYQPTNTATLEKLCKKQGG